ncbi:MAG TPA: PaeR7I family type II restriction endonuclease [Verrucomicrobiae bacterium]|nr:PaeR7I family type II restriction endonuclease [Verrucomicrobiae bacterium]
MPPPTILAQLPKHTREAVRFYWQTRASQSQKQRAAGVSDQGLRSAVTGGAQMDGFIELLTRLAIEAGIDRSHIYYQDSLELPGYFRPSKRWDFLIVVEGKLVAALEAKSQVGPSFGNNFNNRTEEAMGSALDLWTAFRESAFGSAVRPWIGYMFLLEDSTRSTTPVSVKEPHFNVFPEFRNSSYAKRYELFCRRLVLEKHYDGSAFLMSNPESGLRGGYYEPASDLTFQSFANSLVAHVAAFSGRIQQL